MSRKDDPNIVDEALRRGRGAARNEVSRYFEEKREAFDDGWEIEEALTPLRTELIPDHSRTILTRNTSPDIHFDRSVNPYRGCEHGCIYCFARPTHAYLGLSPGLDFESKIIYKPLAVELLAEKLSKPSYTPAPIAMGTNTDPYQPAEKELKITRGILEFLCEYKHPLMMVTKGGLINRDIDILAEMARHDLVSIAISVTTLDHRLHRKLEPRAMAPARRLATIRALSEAGVRVSVLAAPMTPKLNDHELEAILAAAKEAGAEGAGYLTIKMPHEVKVLFRDWLDEHYPERKDKVIRHIQSLHRGRDYISDYGHRMRGSGVYADFLAARYQKAAKRLGLNNGRAPKLRCDLFRPPPQDLRQMELF